MIELPTIHSNGSSKKTMFDDAYQALQDLQTAIASFKKTAPNKRDYYVKEKPEMSFSLATSQFMERLKALEKVEADLNTLAEHLYG